MCVREREREINRQRDSEVRRLSSMNVHKATEPEQTDMQIQMQSEEW